MANELNTMPYNRDAEMALLGCMLIDSEIASDVVEKLSEEDFYQESHKYILRAMQQVFGANEGWPFRTGNVDLRIVGGTVSRRIYAGCYNADNGSIFDLGLKTDYHVENGKINLSLAGGQGVFLIPYHD